MTQQFAPTNTLRGPESDSVRKTQKRLLREADEALGRSRGGLSTKVHLMCDGKGRPLAVLLTPGQRHGSTRLGALLGAIRVPRLVHLHYRFRVVSYSSGHEISDLRTFTFGKGASDPPSRATLQRRFHPAPFADAPSFFEEGGGPANSEESGLRPANGAGCHPRLQRQRRGGPDGQILAPPANPRCLRRGQR